MWVLIILCLTPVASGLTAQQLCARDRMGDAMCLPTGCHRCCDSPAVTLESAGHGPSLFYLGCGRNLPASDSGELIGLIPASKRSDSHVSSAEHVLVRFFDPPVLQPPSFRSYKGLKIFVPDRSDAYLTNTTLLI